MPVGTTCEFVYLSEEERKRIIEFVVDEVNGRVPVIAGIGASSTLSALRLTKYAEDVERTLFSLSRHIIYVQLIKGAFNISMN